MIKTFLLVLLFLPSILFGGQDGFNVVEVYGPKLDRVSFKERYLFNKTMNIDWYESTLEQRKVFLEQFYWDQVAEQERKEEFRKRSAELEESSAAEDKISKRKELAKRKAEAARAKKEEREAEIIKKELDRKHKILLKSIERQRKLERRN